MRTRTRSLARAMIPSGERIASCGCGTTRRMASLRTPRTYQTVLRRCSETVATGPRVGLASPGMRSRTSTWPLRAPVQRNGPATGSAMPTSRRMKETAVAAAAGEREAGGQQGGGECSDGAHGAHPLVGSGCWWSLLRWSSQPQITNAIDSALAGGGGWVAAAGAAISGWLRDVLLGDLGDLVVAHRDPEHRAVRAQGREFGEGHRDVLGSAA